MPWLSSLTVSGLRSHGSGRRCGSTGDLNANSLVWPARTTSSSATSRIRTRSCSGANRCCGELSSPRRPSIWFRCSGGCWPISLSALSMGRRLSKSPPIYAPSERLRRNHLQLDQGAIQNGVAGNRGFARCSRHAWHRGVRIVIANRGPGVPERYKTDIFKDFFSHDPDNHPSTGLGLGMVRRVVRAHGGRVRENGAPGTGARFEIEFPRSVAAPRRHPNNVPSDDR